MSFCSLCRCTDIPTYHPAVPDHLDPGVPQVLPKCIITLSLTSTQSPTSTPSWVTRQAWRVGNTPLHPLPVVPASPLLHPLRPRRSRLVFEDEWKRILSVFIFIELERIFCRLLLSLSPNIFTMPKNSWEALQVHRCEAAKDLLMNILKGAWLEWSTCHLAAEQQFKKMWFSSSWNQGNSSLSPLSRVVSLFSLLWPFNLIFYRREPRLGSRAWPQEWP